MTKLEMITSKGTINLNLFDDDAPMTVASFLYLINQGYYNGLKFHRIIDNFMIQGGCPLGQGTGGPKNKGISSFPYKNSQVNYPFGDEFRNGHVFDKPGLLAMANAGSNTNGSQFFITHIVTDWLTDKHTIFGEIVSSADQDVVNAMEKGDTIKQIKIS